MNEKIEFPYNYIPFLLSTIFLLCCSIFIAGYFLGKRSTLQDFISRVQDESFSDKIYSSLSTLYDNCSSEDKDEVEEDKTCEDRGYAEPSADDLYYAPLAGFSTQKAAEKYRQLLEDRNIHVAVVKRGKKWYQVVTSPMSKNTLLNMIDDLKRRDRLAEISIVKITPE